MSVKPGHFSRSQNQHCIFKYVLITKAFLLG